MIAVLKRLDDPPAEELLEEAARVVRGGGILAVPTESSYALAGAARNDIAIARVKALKGRGNTKPILVLVADRSQLGPFVRVIPPAAAILMEAFWPGPLTLTFPIAPDAPQQLAGTGGTVGIRQPGHSSLRAVLQRVGPLTGTSANLSGDPSINSAAEVLSVFGHAIDLILDGGTTHGCLPSTVVDTGGDNRIVREGAINRADINAVLRPLGFKLDCRSEKEVGEPRNEGGL